MIDFNCFKNKKVAIVYDWIDSWGGVERVLLAMHEFFPRAVFFTSYFDSKKAYWASGLDIRQSFISKLPVFLKRSRLASVYFYPRAFEGFDFSSYDLVISISSSFAKGIVTRPETYHLSYILTPPRYLWGMTDVYLDTSLKKFFSSCIASRLRSWDYVASRRPDRLVSISSAVASRCKKYYGLDSEVVYPPFDLEYWRGLLLQRDGVGESVESLLDFVGKYYLFVGRLEKYKKVDLVMEAFKKRHGSTLLVVGKGREKKRLERMAVKNIYFLENLTDRQLAFVYSNAEALIVPQEEDFGYVCLEAQALGCPVIAYKKGGALETVKDEVSGMFFDEQNEYSLLNVIENFEKFQYNNKLCIRESVDDHLKKFSIGNFFKGLGFL